MASYHAEYIDYFRGDIFTHTLKQTIASQGGDESHWDLFSFLSKPTFGSLSHRDMRCPLSLLFLYPLHVRLYFTWLLHQEEKRLQEGHKLTGDILAPIYLMLMHSKVLGEELSYIYTEASTRGPGTLHELLGLPYPNYTGELVQDVYSTLTTFSRPQNEIDLMLYTIEGGGRVNTAVYIAKTLGYSDASLVSIRDSFNRLYV